LPAGEKIRRTTNKSASTVDEDTNNFTAEGPVISVSDSRGDDRKLTPSSTAEKVIFESFLGGIDERFFSSEPR
jgi:hypothetical protein